MQHRGLAPKALTIGWACVAIACARAEPEVVAVRPHPPPTGATVSDRTAFTKPTERELRERLTPMQYRVTQQDETEPAFRNEFWDHHDQGLYVDVATGEPLFSSRDKFDSGTGWPSFTRPIAPGRVVERFDRGHGMVRVEARSAAGDSHLGHVFDDGPPPERRRFCINSAALRFIPATRLDAEGYGSWRSAVGAAATASVAGSANACTSAPAGQPVGCQATVEEIVLAGGCYWGMEEILRRVPGVIDTEVGFAGGAIERPTYAQVSTGTTGHAESVRVLFDPKNLSVAELLDRWFFRMHDPTTANRQGNDVGSQYRSAIFCTTDAQCDAARAAVVRAADSGLWQRPIVTEVARAGPFWPAHAAHQDYLQKNPGGYTCHWLR